MAGDYLLLVVGVRGLSGRVVRWLGTNLKASIDTDRSEGRGPDRHASSDGRDLTWWKAGTLDTRHLTTQRTCRTPIGRAIASTRTEIC